MEAAILRSYNRAQERAAEKVEREAKLADAPELQSGKQVVVAVIASPRWKESMYGTQAKTIYELEDGNRLWGTIPAKLISPALYDLNDLKGRTVTLSGTVEVSGDDKHFGFISRPKVIA
jgi:hypothetical protein